MHGLSERIERQSVRALELCRQSTQRLYPAIGATVIDVAGGAALFAGADSPLSQAMGMGLQGRVGEDDVARVTRFFFERGAPARVQVSPLADLSLGRYLAQTGYVPVEYKTVLAAEVRALQPVRDARVRVSDDPRRWARASAMGFMSTDRIEEGADSVGRVIASSPGVLALEGYEGRTIVATGAMDVYEDLIALFAGSVLAPYRRQGWQKALILDRIARGVEIQGTYAWAMAVAGSISEWNFRACGFTALSTCAVWEKALPA
jgi:hypothetical protein